MKGIRLLALLGALGMTAVADAQAQVQFEVTPVAGGTFFLADPPDRFALDRTSGPATIIQNGAFDDAWTLGINAGVRLNERWGIEGMFTWLPTKLGATSGLASKADVNGYMYGITGLYYIPLHARFMPFVGLGVGGETFDYDNATIETETELQGNGVIGLYVPLYEMVGLRLEVRDCIARFDSGVSNVDNAWENDLMTTVGISFRFPRR